MEEAPTLPEAECRGRGYAADPTAASGTMMRHCHQMASKCDSELSLPQERVKYAVVGIPEAVVGPSTASYDLVHALPRRDPRVPLRTPRRPPPVVPTMTTSEGV